VRAELDLVRESYLTATEDPFAELPRVRVLKLDSDSWGYLEAHEDPVA